MNISSNDNKKMAYPGIACVLIGVTLATLLYYMFGNNEQEQTHPPYNTGSRYRGSNDHYENNYSSYSDDYHERRRASSGLRDFDECTICLNPLTNGRKIVLKTCSHAFHKKCIEEWKSRSYQKSCPNCRCPFE